MLARKLSMVNIWLGVAVLDIIVVFLFLNGTYDSGDSITHFLQSQNAWEHPKYFLDHWAKPFFILLSSPFSQFGWVGMKLFNTLCILFSSFGVLKFFGEKKIVGLAASLMCLFSTQFFLIQSSGLTEPLFACVLIWSIVLIKKDHLYLGYILFSTLPFVRTEGWLLIPCFLVYILYSKHYIHLLTFISFSILYGIIGYFALGDFLWFIHQNPYQGVEAKYGSGSLDHFVVQLYYKVGLIPYLMSILGVLFCWKLLKTREEVSTVFLLVLGSLLAIVVSHSIFWWQGWFHSMGMTRVLIMVVPLMAIFSGFAFQFITERFKIKKGWFIAVLILLTFGFHLNYTPASIKSNDFSLQPDQILINEVLDSIPEDLLKQSVMYFGSHYVPFAAHRDMDSDKVMELSMLKDYEVEENALIFWDSYFSVTNHEVTDTFLENEKGLVPMISKTTKDGSYTFKVYSSEVNLR